MCFTAVSTLFNLYAMRRGVLVTGADAPSVRSDLRRVPALICCFVAEGLIALYTQLGRLAGWAKSSRNRRADEPVTKSQAEVKAFTVPNYE